jgi:hypothetical protein
MRLAPLLRPPLIYLVAHCTTSLFFFFFSLVNNFSRGGILSYRVAIGALDSLVLELVLLESLRSRFRKKKKKKKKKKKCQPVVAQSMQIP